MNDKILKQQVIHHLAEQGVPDNYNPWEAVQERLETSRAYQKMDRKANMTHSINSQKRLRFTGVALFVLVLAVGVVAFMMTPPGQVVAQSLLNLFVKTDSDVRALPDEQSVPSDAATGLSISKAEELAKYKVVVPASLPDGYSLADVIYIAKTQEVVQLYKYSPYQSGEMFVLTQQVSQPADPIGQSAEVEQLEIGNTVVESVRGSWLAPASSTYEKWNSEAPIQTFRWQKDGFYFTIQFWVNDSFSPAYLSAEDMHTTLETVLGIQSTLPEKVNLNALKSIEEAETAAGFQVLAPTVLPEGFVFSRAVYEQENYRVVLIYKPENGTQNTSGVSLVFFETPVTTSQGTITFEGYPTEALEKITIRQFNGTFIRGAVVDGTYDPDFGVSIVGQTDSLNIAIHFYNSSGNPIHLEKKEMLAIVESLQ